MNTKKNQPTADEPTTKKPEQFDPIIAAIINRLWMLTPEKRRIAYHFIINL